MLLPQYLSQSLFLHHIKNTGMALRTSWKEFGAFKKAAHLSIEGVRMLDLCYLKKKKNIGLLIYK